MPDILESWYFVAEQKTFCTHATPSRFPKPALFTVHTTSILPVQNREELVSYTLYSQPIRSNSSWLNDITRLMSRCAYVRTTLLRTQC